MRRRPSTPGRVIAIAAATLCAIPGSGGRAHTQTPANTGLLMGVIVDARTNQPAANAEVTLGGAPARKVLTDGEGRFVFLDLPGGTYTIAATKPGYADGAYGRRRPEGPAQTLPLGDGERLGTLRIPIWKHAAITGTIRDEAGEPIVDVPVRVLMPAHLAGRPRLIPGAIARTDDHGVYRIGSLVPGDYVVVVPSTQTTAPQSVVDLYAQAWMPAQGRLAPGAPDFGRDMSFSGATTALSLLARPGAAKIGGLAFVSASGNMRAGIPPAPSGDGFYVYPTQYYPAAMTAANAAILTMRSGDERAGVDVQLKPVATARVAGTVSGPSGPIIAVMTLVPESSDLSADVGLETATTLSDAGGRFTFLGVPPGRYLLRALRAEVPPYAGSSRGAPPPPTPTGTKGPSPPDDSGYTLSATESIVVDGTDLDDVAVTVRTGFRISGRAEFPDTAPPPDPDLVRRMSATFDPADARPSVSSVIGRGQFTENGRLWGYQLPPGRYYLRINNAPPGWTLKSALWNGRDISDVPLELDRDVSAVVITFTDRPATLSGQVQNTSGAADAAATVLIFPADPGSWVDYGGFPRRLRAVRTDRDGRFATMGLPPGNYLVAAVAEEASSDWQNPRTLLELARLATKVTLADGQSRQLALSTTTVPPR